jgi:hypothetical protein
VRDGRGAAAPCRVEQFASCQLGSALATTSHVTITQHGPGMKRIHEREHNWGLRQQKWAHTHTRKQAASPNPTTSHSRLQTNSEPDPSAPAGSAKWFVTVKGRPAEQHLSSRHSASSPEAPEQAELDISTTKPTNGYPHDRPLRMPSRHPRPHSPLPPLL